MNEKKCLELISEGQRNFLATRDDRGLIIQQVEPINGKLRPVGPVFTGKVMGHG